MDELVVGTYEGYLLGYSVYSGQKFKQTFATQSHTTAVRCVTAVGKYMASGSTDDKVVVIDLKTRKEHTVIMNHNGTVNAVAFTHGGTHLLSGSDDGSIIVTRTGNWQIEKKWKKAHGGQPVTTIAVHPSDKLALSVGGDKTLRTWNLVKGRPAFTINLASKGITTPTEVMFAPGGDRFSMVTDTGVDVWSIAKAGLEKRITFGPKPITVQWTSDERVFIGLANGNIVTLTITNPVANTYPAHNQRVKCLHFENNTMYSASSAGELKAWTVEDSVLTELGSVKAGCRVTCMTLNRQNHLVKKEEQSDEEKEVNDEKEQESEDNDEDDSLPLVRKPGAFVKVSYDSDDDEKESSPPAKKAKKRKRNRKQNKN